MPYDSEALIDPETGLYRLPRVPTHVEAGCPMDDRKLRAEAVFTGLSLALDLLTVPILSLIAHNDSAADILWHDLNTYITSVVQYAEGAGVDVTIAHNPDLFPDTE